MSPLPALDIRLTRPEPGAPEPWPIDTLSQHLAQAGHRVRVMDAGDPHDGTVDVVHCFGTPCDDALSTGSAVGPPVLVTPPVDAHGVVTPSGGGSALSSAASVVVRSSGAQEQVHRLGVPWYRTWVLPVGVDVATFTRLGPMAKRTDRFRLMAEAFGPGDGIEDVIAALAMLEGTELVVLVGDSVERSRTTAVRAAAEGLGVASRCAVVTPRDDGERAWWLRSAHVAVVVPHSPRGADFAAQAMACATPVVATPVDALVDLVVHGVTGFLVTAGDHLAVARGVRQVLEDEFTVESYGLAASDRAQSRLAWERVTNELVGVYRRVAGAAAGVDEVEPPDVEDLLDDSADEGDAGPLRVAVP